MSRILPLSFYRRPTLRVAKELLGKHLVVERRGKKSSFLITEVEAYDGHEDKASHASRGLTERTKVMFGPAGVWYVYLVYGMHWMLNVVTGPKNYPAAVLIRGAVGDNLPTHWRGPGKLTKALGITKRFNNQPAVKKTGLWFEDRGVKIHPKQIKKSARIGVAYAGPVWAKKPYRFYLDKLPF